MDTKTKTTRRTGGLLVALLLLGTFPGATLAQKNRQETKNDWRNLAALAGGLTAFGLIKNDKTLAFVGAAGALYSVDRYEKDRKSQDKAARTRASLFSNGTIYRDGKRYERHTVTRNGHKYYRFTRAKN